MVEAATPLPGPLSMLLCARSLHKGTGTLRVGHPAAKWILELQLGSVIPFTGLRFRYVVKFY